MLARGRSADVIVVGAGIIGATIAYHFASKGAQVDVVDAIAPAGGSTRHALGLIAPQPTALQATLHSIADVQRVAQALGVPVQPTTALYIARDEAEAKVLRAAITQATPDAAEWVDSASGLPEGCAGAVMFREALMTDVPALVQHMLRAPGVNVHAPVEVLKLEQLRGQTAIVANGYVATAQYIVLATNAFAGLLSPYLADSVAFAHGIAWTSHAGTTSNLPMPVVTADGTFAALQQAAERCVHALAWSEDDKASSPEALLEHWLRAFGVDPIRQMHKREQVVTTCSPTADGMPLIGQLGEDGRVLYAMGAGLFGVVWAAHIAEQLWQLATHTS